MTIYGAPIEAFAPLLALLILLLPLLPKRTKQHKIP